MDETTKVITMTRTSSLPLLAFVLALPAGLATAQQGGTANTPPPKLERIEPGSDVPATTIPPKRGTQVKERKSDGGQVTEVEVTTPGGSQYTMKPTTQANGVPDGKLGPPQWKVGTFDLSGKRRAKSDAGKDVPTPADVPPPPPMPATAGQEK